MPALSFQKRFVPAVENGSKAHSIRAKRSRAWLEGDTLALYTGMRTKACRLLFRTVVTKVQDITIDMIPGWNVKPRGTIWLDGALLSGDELEAFALADGFENHADMMVFWRDHHALPFHGDVIYWKRPEIA